MSLFTSMGIMFVSGSTMWMLLANQHKKQQMAGKTREELSGLRQRMIDLDNEKQVISAKLSQLQNQMNQKQSPVFDDRRTKRSVDHNKGDKRSILKCIVDDNIELRDNISKIIH